MKHLIALILILFCSISYSQLLTKIKVGMTYDEVKKVLGSPTTITRGFTEVENWELTTKGQLMYVTWLYPTIRSDTVYHTLPKYQNTYSKIDQHFYFINGLQFEEEEFKSIQVDSSGEITFWTEQGGHRKIDKILWLNYGRIFLHEKQLVELVNSGRPIQMRDSVGTGRKLETTAIAGSLGQVPIFITTFAYAILFDAASGLVVDKRYLPIEAEKTQPFDYLYK